MSVVVAPRLLEIIFFSIMTAFVRQLRFFCCYICTPKESLVQILSTATTNDKTEPHSATSTVPILVGTEFVADDREEYDDGHVEKIDKQSKRFYLEDIQYTSPDTYDEVEREWKSVCVTTTSSKIVSLAGTDSRLKYKNSLALSMDVYHSSFGSEILFQPATQSPKHGIYGTSHSLLLPSMSKSDQYFCYTSATLADLIERGDEADPAKATKASRASWRNSVVLRAVWEGAKVNTPRCSSLLIIMQNLRKSLRGYQSFVQIYRT